jgi:hypothetical protein
MRSWHVECGLFEIDPDLFFKVGLFSKKFGVKRTLANVIHYVRVGKCVIYDPLHDLSDRLCYANSAK